MTRQLHSLLRDDSQKGLLRSHGLCCGQVLPCGWGHLPETLPAPYAPPSPGT